MKHSERTKEELKKIKANQSEILEFGHSSFSKRGSKVYAFDFVVIGIIKRTVSLSSAFVELIENWNLVCTRALLRMHVDTAIRLSAFWLHKSPQEMSKKVIGGQQINKMKDKNGNRMTDNYLVKQLSKENSWIMNVYKYTSSYIHFSEKHLFDPIAKTDNANKIAYFLINDKDYKYPELSWYELANTFNDIYTIIFKYLNLYKKYKNILD